MDYTVNFRIARASYIVIPCHSNSKRISEDYNKFLKLIHPKVVNVFENMLLVVGGFHYWILNVLHIRGEHKDW